MYGLEGIDWVITKECNYRDAMWNEVFKESTRSRIRKWDPSHPTGYYTGNSHPKYILWRICCQGLIVPLGPSYAVDVDGNLDNASVLA